jgi:hypothetical protein
MTSILLANKLGMSHHSDNRYAVHSLLVSKDGTVCLRELPMLTALGICQHLGSRVKFRSCLLLGGRAAYTVSWRNPDENGKRDLCDQNSNRTN